MMPPCAIAESGNAGQQQPQQPQQAQESEEVLQLRASVERMESQARAACPSTAHVFREGILCGQAHWKWVSSLLAKPAMYLLPHRLQR